MKTVVELRKEASRLKIPGRSKLRTKKDLLLAITSYKSKKVSRKVSRKRKSIKRKSIKRKSIKSRSKSRKLLRNDVYRKVWNEIKDIQEFGGSKPNPAGYKKQLRLLGKKYRDNLLDSVRFDGPNNFTTGEFGNVSFFRTCLEKKLGKNWAKRILDNKDKLENVVGVKRLGVPGRQGVVILLTCADHANTNKTRKYAVKVTRKGAACGNGKTTGFLKQANMQQLAAMHGITPPVFAVYCGGKKTSSFMVMQPLAKRVNDVYPRGTELSLKHQKQLWNIYLTLDGQVGLLHNDLNCLNLMIDSNGDLKLIDFDRSSLIDVKRFKKLSPYPNLSLVDFVNCFSMYGIRPGKNLIKWYPDLFLIPNNGIATFRGIRSLKSTNKHRVASYK